MENELRAQMLETSGQSLQEFDRTWPDQDFDRTWPDHPVKKFGWAPKQERLQFYF